MQDSLIEMDCTFTSCLKCWISLYFLKCHLNSSPLSEKRGFVSEMLRSTTNLCFCRFRLWLWFKTLFLVSGWSNQSGFPRFFLSFDWLIKNVSGNLVTLLHTRKLWYAGEKSQIKLFLADELKSLPVCSSNVELISFNDPGIKPKFT